MGDLLLPAEQAILLGNLPLECDLIPGAVLFSRLCTCVGKSHLYLAQEPLSITELVLVKHQQELISGQLSVPDSKAQLKMLFLPNLCSFQMGSPVLAKGLPSRLLRSSLVPLLAAARVHGGKTSLALVAGFADKKKLVPETSATATLALISVVSHHCLAPIQPPLHQNTAGNREVLQREEQKLAEESGSHQRLLRSLQAYHPRKSIP